MHRHKPSALTWATTALLAAGTALGQPKGLVVAGVDYVAPTRGKDAAVGESREVGVTDTQLSLNYGLKLGKGTIVAPGIKYRFVDIQTENQPIPVDRLHSLLLNTAWIQKFGERWRGMFIAGVGLASDFEDDLHEDDVVFVFRGVGSYEFSDDFSLGAGVGYDRRTGKFQPLPLVSLNWHFAPRWRLAGIAPVHVELGFRASERVTTGIVGGLTGDRFHLGAENIGADRVDLAYSVAKVGPHVTMHFGKAFHLQLRSGIAFLRRFEGFVDDEPVTGRYLKEAAYFGAAFWLGPSGWRSGTE